MKINLTPLIFLILFAFSLKGQVIFSDNFSSNTWTAAGTQIINIDPCGLPPGSLTIDNLNSNELNFDVFRGQQTYRLQKMIGQTLSNLDKWRAEFKFNVAPSAEDYVFVFSITENIKSYPTDFAGNFTNNENSGVNFIISDPYGSSSSQISAKIRGKYDDILYSPSLNIPLSTNTTYYLRIERTAPDKILLSIFSDVNRTSHISGSPICYDLDDRITDLKYMQFGVGTTASCARSGNVVVDDLALYHDIKGSCGVECDVTANMEITLEGCQYRFTNTSVIGAGNTFMGSVINFGDNSYQEIGEPGSSNGSLTHIYELSGNYTPCITTFSYFFDGENYICCSDKYCFDRLVAEKCEGEDNHSLPLLEGEVCAFDPILSATVDCNGNVLFSNNSQMSSGQFLTTVVDFGDGSNPIEIGLAEDFSHHFSPGQYEVCITIFGYSINSRGEFGCCQEEICIIVNVPEPCIDEHLNKDKTTEYKSHEFVVYPNPASTQLYLELKKGDNRIQIFDVSGKKVFETEVREKLIQRIDISAYPKGTYVILVNDHIKMKMEKFIKH